MSQCKALHKLLFFLRFCGGGVDPRLHREGKVKCVSGQDKWFKAEVDNILWVAYVIRREFAP